MAKAKSLHKKEKAKETGGARVKRMNLFLTIDHILALERIRAKRLIEGAELSEVDKSKLIREAIDLLIKQEGV